MDARAERGTGERDRRSGLPLAARRIIWNRLWDRLLAPADLRDPDEIPAHQRKDVSPDRHDDRGGLA